MKSIILFRHGQAEIGSIYRDHDRPLTYFGVREAKKMGHYIYQKHESPDLVITSTAIRAKTTAEIAMASGNWNCPLYSDPDIYICALPFLLSLIKKQDNKYSSICLVGHEPNFSSFIASATCSKNMDFPMASMVKIGFNVIKWNDVIMGHGNLDWFLIPELLFSL